MKDRLVTAGGALLALLAVVAIGLADYQPPATRPTSVEAGPNGYRALRDWLQDGGIEVASHRGRLTGLTERYGIGNLLVSTLPYQLPMQQDEIRGLRAWVAAGNTLLLLAALNDTPDWSAGAVPDAFLDDLAALTGMAFETVETAMGRNEEEVLDVLQPQRTIALRPVAAHPLTAGVQALAGVTDGRTDVWQVASAPAALRLRVAVTESEGVDAIWQIRHGDGHVLLAGLGSLAVNRNIAAADNARFVANVVRHHLAVGKRAIFDDMHQGLSSLYDPAAFFKDQRLHASIAFVLALWFVYMIGTWNRLASPRQRAAEPGQQDFVRAVGGFFARKLGAVEAGRQLFRFCFVELAGRGSRFEQPPWRQLDVNPAIDKALLATIKADHARLSAGKRVDLRRLRNRLRQLTGQT